MMVIVHSQKKVYKNEQILKEPALTVNMGDLTAFSSNLERPTANFSKNSEKNGGLRADFPIV